MKQPRFTPQPIAGGGEPAAIVSPAAAPLAGGAIADLSYRSYDGPHHTRALRWWIVTLFTLRRAQRTPLFWVLAGLAALPFIWAGFLILLLPLLGAAGGSPFGGGATATNHALSLFQAFSNQGFFVFLAALTIGAGTIAADNRANALLVYLSKPVTKADYLLGKWMGLFLPLYAIGAAPALLLWAFCLAMFAHQGFLHNEPTLLPRVMLAPAVPAALYASLLVGLSAWSKRPAVAGVLFASLYFLSWLVCNIAWAIRFRGDLARGVFIHALSLSGLVNGLAQNIYAVTLTSAVFHRSSMMVERISLPPPSWKGLIVIFTVLIVVGIVAARVRIHAVEVVRG